MSDPATRLPVRASLEQLRKQAKELLRAFRAGVESAVQRVRAVNPRTADPAVASTVTLADAQFVLAREHGFESWARLVHHVEATRPSGLETFERFAEEIAKAYMAGDATAMREINWNHSTSFIWDHEPERMRRRLSTWYASTSRSPELALTDARHLVAKQSGLDSWEELVRSLAAGSTRPDRGEAHTGNTAPFYHIDTRNNRIDVHGPISESDWDTVFAVMKEMRLTALGGAGQISDAALERLARLDDVTSLDLSFAKRVTPTGLRHLARLPLRDLQRGGWGTEVDDAGLAVLRDLPELRTISLVWAQRVSDAGIVNLADCTHLQSVNLMGTPTGDGALRALAGKSSLSALDAGTRVTPHGLEQLRAFPRFANRLPDEIMQQARASDKEPTHVSLYPAAFVQGGLDALADLHGIYSLRLFGMDRNIPPITAAALKPVVALHGLESLWCDPSDDAMAVIAALPRLRKLMCQDTAASDDGWVALSRSTTIEGIWGRENTNLRGRGLVALSAMPALRTLGVNLGRVDHQSLTALARFPALRDLTPIGLGDDAFTHIGRCVDLESLTCMYTSDIGDAATAHLTGLRHLRKYYAGDTSITDRSLEILAALPALETVELWSCPAITNAGLATLAKSPRLRAVSVEGLPHVTRDAMALFGTHVNVRISG